MVDWRLRSPFACLYYMRGCGQIGVADAEADDVHAFFLDLAFEPVQFGEEVRRQ
jgi:hypothetical protein